MKFAITAEQRQYYYQHQLLELEELISEAQQSILLDAIEKSVLKKFDTKTIKVKNLTPDKLFMAGHDVWRNDPQIGKIVSLSKQAEIAAELSRARVLRLGYDQWFPSAPPAPSPFNSNPTAYDQFLSKTDCLKNISCLQKVVCGLMLCLSDYEGDTTEAYEGAFPRKKGSGVFISPEKQIDFPTLHKRGNQQFLLIVYTEKTTLYTMQPNDPHVHELKNLGFVFGDRLNDHLHPIIYR